MKKNSAGRKAWRRLLVLLCLAIGAGLVVPQAASAGLVPAQGIHIRAAHSSMCLNVDRDRKINGVPVVQHQCGDSLPNDKWLVRPVGTSGQYQIVSTSSNLCLHVSGAQTADNTPIIQYNCHDTAPQNLWRFVAVAGKPVFTIVSAQTGKCLTVRDNSLQVNIAMVIWPCNGARNSQFSFPPAPSPDPIPLETVAGSPMVAVQGGPEAGAAAGPIVYAWTDNAGRMWRGYQPSPDNTTDVQWSPVPGLEQFAGHPQIAVQAQGRVVTAARNTADGDLWLTTQTAAGSSVFGSPQDAGGASAQQPAFGRLPNGNLVAFAVVRGMMWHLPYDGHNTPYAAWRQLSLAGLAGEPTVVTTRDGLRVFVLDTNGVLQTAAYTGGALGDLSAVGTRQFTGRVAAVVLPGYRTRLFARDADGLIHTTAERSDGTFDPEWRQVGDFTAAGPPAAVMEPYSGRVAVVARGADQRVHVALESAQASGEFGGWAEAHERTVRTDPTIISYTREGGPAWGYVVLGEDDRPFLYRSSGNGSAARASARTATMEGFTEHALPRPR